MTYRLNVFFPTLPKVGCPLFLEIQQHWGKVMKRSGLRIRKKILIKRCKFFFIVFFCEFRLNKSLIIKSIKSVNGPKIQKSGTISENNFLNFF